MLSVIRSLTIVTVLVAAVTTQAQSQPPYNMHQAHPNISVPPVGSSDLSGSYSYILGLTWKTVTDLSTGAILWRGYYADGLICLRCPVPVESGDHVEYIWPANEPNFMHWGSVSQPPSQSHIPEGHSTLTCKWFAVWSNSPGVNPTRDISFTVKIRVTHNGVVTEYPYALRIRICGGPVQIRSEVTSVPNKTLTRHTVPLGHSEPSDDGDSEHYNLAYPWYCTDFGYNPFHYVEYKYRAKEGMQRPNIFAAKPLWQQPPGIKMMYELDKSGVFTNEYEDLEPLSTSVNPQRTLKLSQSSEAFIACDGDQDSNDIISLTAYYCDELQPGEPGVGEDQSGSFYGYQDIVENKTWRNGFSYAKFKPHRPVPIVIDRTAYILGSVPQINNETHQGINLIYQVRDQYGTGMPGIQVQERFVVATPSGFWTNNRRHSWTTIRKSDETWTYNDELTNPPIDGNFNAFDTIFLRKDHMPATFPGHEYWAATDQHANGISYYPIRDIPNSNPPANAYVGIFVGGFDIVFEIDNFNIHRTATVSHEDYPPPTQTRDQQ